jgi:hypothetical protein
MIGGDPDMQNNEDFKKQLEILLQRLQGMVRSGDLTPTPKVDVATLCCIVETRDGRKSYHQTQYDVLSRDWQHRLRGMRPGDRCGELKLMACYDIWYDA